MRVITGSARGRTLETLPGDDVRPTVDRVKEAVFSIIQFELEGRRVLDLFGGSGQMAVEALSRGAASATILDNSRRAIDVIRRNLQTTGLADRAVVLEADALAFVRNNRSTFDIAFLDPPYDKGLLQKVLPDLAGRMAKGGVILCESPVGEELPEVVGAYSIYRTYRYGKTKITAYRDTVV
ncbi:MAG: 16S rRNA (guanine(966)-N(2))-methyltransferase RsmD [Clostridia bacterium]|nr:16S rRNA (guanine(966)-N(2))-methyltransferase RsmD [Clostridia bacterium]